MMRVLVVDDDPQIVRTLQINLRVRGYAVDFASDGAGALRLALRARPDLVVLDLGLPDMDGLEVIRGLRSWTAVPVVVLTGRSGGAVAALDAGADDYLTKPFLVEELLARLRAVARRRLPTSGVPSVRIGRYVVDVADRTLRGGDPSVRLTPTEWHLLEILVRHEGRLVSHRQLLREVWGPSYEGSTNYLRQYVTQLRHKLEYVPSRPQHLLTEPGVGYRLVL
ncbi:two-component system KDP operon response regulator KdpE [Asanoa ferruginea]|uniref:Two-component system KDP operon response regulator KdpE n=1 Tax=Asanoa ferruginea TaxID=53367 RepID=A0A3D9ZWN6_9ACTN|nr:response regulator transcription factor [Asanoa ferruginea]REG01619.1 two-component system KDP operon response regulator KdpE [Asanoa ferruginea]GIF53860.1 DNA-binding response regulator [Asanoa ferruginea]